ncbi:hypothetical protein Emed_003821 [Eimeria media]
MALLFLISLCRSFSTKQADLLLAGRKLAFDDDHEEQTICKSSDEDTLNESDSRSPQTSLSASELPGEPSHSGDENDSKSESEDAQPSTSEGRPRKRRASELHLGFVQSKDKQQTPSEEVHESVERSEEEMEAANALLTLHESFGMLSESTAIVQETSWASVGSTAPALSPYVLVPIRAASTAASQVTASSLHELLGHPVRVHLPTAPALSSAVASVTAAGLEGSGVSVGDARTGTLSEEERPSTSSAVETAAACSEPRVHPYYRIPSVNPLYKGVRRFQPERAKSFAFANLKTCVQLNKMRMLLAEDQLLPIQLNELARVTYELLSYVFYYETFSTKRLVPSVASRILGRRYLFLDAAVAALQVLEEPLSQPWWEEIVSAIPDDTAEGLLYAPARHTPATIFHRDLLKKLHWALRVLKTGTRLSEEETIGLKRKLFCSRFSPSAFKESKWDPWREDDKKAGEGS